VRVRTPSVTVLIAAGPALLVALLSPGAARAGNDLGLTVGPVDSVGGAICVTYAVESPFTPRLEETLLRGMPATVTFEVGLWRRRTLWFDKLVLAITSEHKVVYDPWAQAFRVRSGGAPRKPRLVPSLDSLKSVLFSERRLPLVSFAALDSTARYYVSVRTTIRPLSPEDLGEVEDWLSGEVKGPSGAPRGVPGYQLGIAVNLSGLGDRTALAKSVIFRTPLLAAPN
jgi:hypothetical protein